MCFAEYSVFSLSELGGYRIPAPGPILGPLLFDIKKGRPRDAIPLEETPILDTWATGIFQE